MTKNSSRKVFARARLSFLVILLVIAVKPVQGAPVSPAAKIFSPAFPERMYLISGTLLSALCIYTFDEQINRYYASPREGFLYDLGKGMSRLTQFYGENNARVAYFYTGLSTALYAGGWLKGDDRMKRTSLLITRSMAYTLAVSFGTKMIIGRARPGMGVGAHEFFWFEFSKSKDRRSFFSGHTATAVAMMTVLMREYPTPWVEVPATLFALCVGAQRIVTGEHWASDVIIGGLTGYWIGKAVATRQPEERSESRASFSPYIFPGHLGFTIYF